MSMDSLVNMFTQRTGAQQSVSGSIMNAIVGYLMQSMMQKGVSSFLGGIGGTNLGNGTSGGVGDLKTTLSNLSSGSLSPNHPLVQQVQQSASIQDPNEATQYTQHGINVLNEQANSNPEGILSMLGGFLGGSGTTGSNSQQQNESTGRGGGLLGDTLGI